MKKRFYKKAFCWLLTFSLLFCLIPINGVAEGETTADYEEETELDFVPTPIAPEGGVQGGQITESEIITPEPDASVTANIVQQTMIPIQNGVYTLVNILTTGKCVDTRGGGTTAGTAVQQWTTSDSVIRNQLFKVTYLGSDMSDNYPHHYYSIRPMTNSEMGLSAPLTGTNRPVTLQPMSYTDTYASIPPEQRWEIIPDDYYWIKNGSTTNGGYLAGITQGSNGDQLITIDEAGNSDTSWDFVPYTGEEINGVKYQITTDSMRIGDSFTFQACVYSSVIGRNGPAVYSVRDNVMGTNTDRATINASTGELTVKGTGTVVVRASYATGCTWWLHSVSVWIDEGTYFIKNRGTGDYLEHALPAIVQVDEYDSSTLQRWQIIADSNGSGYYFLKNCATLYYLKTPDSTSTATDIGITTLTTENREHLLWRFVFSSDGAVRIQAKQREGSAIVLATGLAYSITANHKVMQYTTGYPLTGWDEWYIQTGNVYLNFSHDQGFITANRMGAETNSQTILRISESILEDYYPVVAHAFAQECGIYFMNKQNAVTQYTSDADNCTSIGINTRCTCISDTDCILQYNHNPNQNNNYNGFTHNAHCKSMTRIRNNMIVNIPENTIKVTYTGHVSCYYSVSNGHNYNTIGLSDYDYPIVAMRLNQTDTDRNILVLAHELSHTYGVVHHAPVAGDPCIMDYNRYQNNFANDPSTFWCENCIATISANKNLY